MQLHLEYSVLLSLGSFALRENTCHVVRQPHGEIHASGDHGLLTTRE